LAQFTWTYDSPTGTYKNHAMSGRLYEVSLAETIMVDYVRPVEGFGRKRGESVTLTRVAELSAPTSPVLREGYRIPEDTLSMSTRAMTPQEIGRSVPYTSLSDDLSEWDMDNIVQRRLRNQMRFALDSLAGAAFKKAAIKYVPDGATSNTITTNGTPGATATVNMNVWHVEEIRDYMFDTLFVPPYEGGDYVGIFRTLGLRGIKRDPDWEQWHVYTDPQAKYNGEVGRIENVRFVESNNAAIFGKKGTGSVLGEGVIFGEDPVGMVEVITPELRVARPEDFGRSRAVAWYGLLSFDIIWETGNAGEAKIVHVTSDV
jgi:N4-gp56 family major capsid protein